MCDGGHVRWDYALAKKANCVMSVQPMCKSKRYIDLVFFPHKRRKRFLKSKYTDKDGLIIRKDSVFSFQTRTCLIKKVMNLLGTLKIEKCDKHLYIPSEKHVQNIVCFFIFNGIVITLELAIGKIFQSKPLSLHVLRIQQKEKKSRDKNYFCVQTPY